MIIRARVVVTMDGPPIQNGAVAVSRDRITDVGKFSEVKARYNRSIDDSPPGSSPSRASRLRRSTPAGSVVDLGEQALLPGLINAHCHLDYTCLRGKIPRQKSFTDWIRAINAEKAKLSPEDYVRSINEGFAEAKRFGTTTIANLTAFPELMARIQSPIRTWWLAELIDVRDLSRGNEVVDFAVEQLKSAEHWGLAPHAPFTASTNLYRRCEEIARSEDVLLTTHLAESGEEMSMFRDTSGPLYDFMKEIGRDMNDCGRNTPLSQFTEIVRDSSTSVGMTDGWMVVHLNELTESDFDLLKESTTKFSIMHCPRSHAYFGHSPFPFEKLRELGFNICLGTDSLASNDDLSLFAEMRAFQRKFPSVSAQEIVKMVTTSPARALRQENLLGKIRSGFVADLIAIPIARHSESVLGRTRWTSAFEEIIGFDRPAGWSMIDGQVQNSA
jgi:aminodeoxyfutalosine deaminase